MYYYIEIIMSKEGGGGAFSREALERHQSTFNLQL